MIDPNGGLLCPVCSAFDLISVILQGRRVGSFACRNKLTTEGDNVFI